MTQRRDWVTDSDEAFERELMLSARADVGPADPQQAWQHLQAALVSVAAGAALEGGSDAASSQPGAARVTAGSGRRRVVALVVAGIVSGGLVTALALLALLDWQRPAPPPPVRLPAVPGAASESAPRSPPGAGLSAVTDRTTAAPQIAMPQLAAAHIDGRDTHGRDTHGRDTHAREHVPVAASKRSDPSDLRAQVTLVDAARAALSGGAYDSALRAVARFHREFPRGELAPDADTLAIEALAAQGAFAQVSQRAAEFLTRYPDDPHAARVRAIAERPASR